MFFLRRFARRIIPKVIRTWLGKGFDDVLIWYLKFRWLQKRKFKSLDPPQKDGVLLIGYPRGEFGIGSLLRFPALALEEAGVPFKVFDFNPIHKQVRRIIGWINGSHICLNIESIYFALVQINYHF